jgi:hypothetical protein
MDGMAGMNGHVVASSVSLADVDRSAAQLTPNTFASYDELRTGSEL